MNPWLKAKMNILMARLLVACSNYGSQLLKRQEQNTDTRYQTVLVEIEVLAKPEWQNLIINLLTHRASI